MAVMLNGSPCGDVCDSCTGYDTIDDHESDTFVLFRSGLCNTLETRSSVSIRVQK